MKKKETEITVIDEEKQEKTYTIRYEPKTSQQAQLPSQRYSCCIIKTLCTALFLIVSSGVTFIFAHFTLNDLVTKASDTKSTLVLSFLFCFAVFATAVAAFIIVFKKNDSELRFAKLDELFLLRNEMSTFNTSPESITVTTTTKEQQTGKELPTETVTVKYTYAAMLAHYMDCLSEI